jgi:hypothetical protein
VNPFETETMADLCMRQGHHAEALAIYRRLLKRSIDEAERERIARRIAAAERDVAVAKPRAATWEGLPAPEVPLPVPGVRVRWSGDDLSIEWRLPRRNTTPGLEVLLVTRGPSGVATETRAIDVDADAGRITMTVKGLHLARVAAGFRTGDHFVPVART